jgi:hypothetical protein
MWRIAPGLVFRSPEYRIMLPLSLLRLQGHTLAREAAKKEGLMGIF